MTDPSSSYEELPYTRNPFFPTHPDCLATVARLHGLRTPAVSTCRVLELGCASGGNLIPMAAALPKAHFVGIDLSPRQIAQGQELIAVTGLKNVELKALSIMDVDAHFGTFDYIIAHGVFSWVPDDVRAKMLQICADLLAPNGVAYISYNTYPGWHLRGMVRDMLAYHVQRSGAKQPQQQVRQARGFLDFLSKSVRDPKGVYAHAIQEEVEVLGGESDTYVFHEHLEEINTPLFFKDFAARAAAHGLQYVSEAQAWAILSELPPHVREVLDKLGTDRIAREQYLDFLAGRLFRRSVLCRAGIPLTELTAEALPDMRATTLVKPANAHPDIHSDAVEEFRTAKNVSLSTNSPPVKALLTTLFQAWPRSLAFDQMEANVREVLGRGTALEQEWTRQRLASVLLHCYQAHLIELHLFEPAFVLEISERPLACPVARALAESESHIPNRRHCSVKPEDVDRLVLRHLDGRHDRAALLDVLRQGVTDGVLELPAGQDLSDREGMSELLNDTLDVSLRHLAGNAVLVR